MTQVSAHDVRCEPPWRIGRSAYNALTPKNSTRIVETGLTRVAIRPSMLRPVSKLLRTHSERLLALVLVPALVLGTLPQTACICSDGHVEPACRGLASGSANSCSGCACCQKSERVRSCCRAKCEQSPVEHEPL